MSADDLAEAVRGRRAELRLPIDLSQYGGPSEMTVRKVESGRPLVRPSAKSRLERALRWPANSVDQLLDGQPVAWDGLHVDPSSVSDGPDNPRADLGAALVWATYHVTGQWPPAKAIEAFVDTILPGQPTAQEELP